MQDNCSNLSSDDEDDEGKKEKLKSIFKNSGRNILKHNQASEMSISRNNYLNYNSNNYVINEQQTMSSNP